MEIIFDKKFLECSEELSKRDFVNYLQTCRTGNGLIVAVSTKEITPQYFLGYWQSLEEQIGFSPENNAESVACGHGNTVYYCMGPARNICADLTFIRKAKGAHLRKRLPKQEIH